MSKKILKIVVLIFFIIILNNCFSFDTFIRESKEQIDLIILETILKQANDLIGKKAYSSVTVNGKNFKLDCIGTVSAIFYSAGIDIKKYFNKYNGKSGVSSFYHTLEDNKTIYNSKKPEIGDVVFWDNTWDRNNDGIIGNDPLTHVGMVVQIDDDGTIHFIHANYVRGIVIEQMNLKNPSVYKDKNGKIINSPMYINSSLKKHPKYWLSGDLFKHFGRVLKIKEIF